MKKLLIALIVLGLAAPAMAADFYFYGSLRTHLGYYDVDEDYAGGPAIGPTIGDAGDSDSGTLLNLSGQSRFGAKAIASENLYGVFEFGIRETTREQSDDVEEFYLRLAYGVWTFGTGKLTVGKDYTPGTFLGYSSMMADVGDQGGANMLVAGLSYIGRQPQIKLTFGNFDIALIEPNYDARELHPGDDIDFDMPRIEAAYVFKTGIVSVRPVAGFQMYDVEFAGGEDDSVTSYLLGLGVSLDLKPAYIKATVSYMQNAQNYGQSHIVAVASRSANLVGDEFEDSTLLQGTLVAGMRFNEKFGIEAGVGYANTEVEYTPGNDGEQTGWIYYLQGAYTLAPGMTLIPEVGMVNRDELEFDTQIPGILEDTDLGEMVYADLIFRVDF